jgi:hypothetical protein
MLFSMFGCHRPLQRFSNHCGLMGVLRICLVPLQLAALDRETGWNETNYETAFAPENHRGPGSIGVSRQGLGGTNGGRYDNPGSANLHAVVPVLNLPGRRLDLVLAFHYNSRLWHKAGTQRSFNIDTDWPAPGWLLGFGKLEVAGQQGNLLIEPDGMRHPLTRQLKLETPGGYRVYVGYS